MVHAPDQQKEEILIYLKKKKKHKALQLIFDFTKMVKVKLCSGVINSFHGDEDVVAWLNKVFTGLDDETNDTPTSGVC